MIRSRTAQLACLIPGRHFKASSSSCADSSLSSSNAASRSRRQRERHVYLEDEEVVEEEEEEEEVQQQQQPHYYTPSKHHKHHHHRHHSGLDHSSEPGLLTSSSDSSSTTTWADVTCALEGLELGSLANHHHTNTTSTSTTPPQSPSPRYPDHVRNYSITNVAISPIPIPGTPTRSRSSGSLSSMATSSTTASGRSRSRSRTRPLTSPLPRSSPRSTTPTRSHRSLSSPLPLPPSQKVMDTMALLKSIKLQIKALKRRESRLGCELHVQRRERQQMRDQIAYLEARRLRVEALFLRPLPLILLWPTGTDDCNHSAYDVCLVSEGNDAWTAVEQPLLRIEQLQLPLSCPDRPVLVHFGPTTTHPMAAAFTIVPPHQYSTTTMTTNHNNTHNHHPDIQPVVKHADLPFWERVISTDVLNGEACWELESASCQFLFESLMEQKDWWRHSMTPVVDKKTRRVQWVLAQQAQETLYYETIPMH